MIAFFFFFIGEMNTHGKYIDYQETEMEMT